MCRINSSLFFFAKLCLGWGDLGERKDLLKNFELCCLEPLKFMIERTWEGMLEDFECMFEFLRNVSMV